MTQWYQATCLKEIFWHGMSVKAGETVRLLREDVDTLVGAGVVDDVKRLTEKDRVETATRSAPEKAIRRRGRNANKHATNNSADD